jgi:hypothetical protein
MLQNVVHKLLLKFFSVTLRALLLDDGTLCCNQTVIIILFDLVQRLRMSGTVPLLHLCTFMVCTGTALPLPFLILVLVGFLKQT